MVFDLKLPRQQNRKTLLNKLQLLASFVVEGVPRRFNWVEKQKSQQEVLIRVSQKIPKQNKFHATCKLILILISFHSEECYFNFCFTVVLLDLKQNTTGILVLIAIELPRHQASSDDTTN